jgi:hypothetical protein
MEGLSDKLLLKIYEKALQLNQEHRSKEDYLEVLEAEIRKRGLPLKERSERTRNMQPKFHSKLPNRPNKTR